MFCFAVLYILKPPTTKPGIGLPSKTPPAAAAKLVLAVSSRAVLTAVEELNSTTDVRAPDPSCPNTVSIKELLALGATRFSPPPTPTAAIKLTASVANAAASYFHPGWSYVCIKLLTC